MVSSYLVAFVAILAVAYADDQPCSKQLEAELQCMITVKTGAEAQKLKEAVKQAHKTCAPSIPDSCHAEMEAVHECTTDLVKNVDSNANLKDAKKEAEAAVDECFTKHPPNVFKAFEEIFMPKHNMGHFGKFGKFRKHHRKGHHGGKHNDTVSSSEESSAEKTSSEEGSSSNETSSSREHHGGKKWHRGCRHGRHGGGRRGGWEHKRNQTSSSGSASSSKENNTSSEGSSGEKKHGMKPECRPTKEQKKCIFHEFKKLGNDTALVETVNTLVNQKKKCKQLISWSCSDKTPPREFCMFKKTKSFRKAFIKELEACVEKKGFTLPPFLLRTGGDASKIIAATTPVPPAAST